MAVALSQRVPDRSATAPGTGRLVVATVAGQSAVVSAFAASPLKWLTPANHGHAAWVYTSTYGGGLVDGDSLAIDIEVREHAVAFVSTQASTKIYRSPAGTAARVTARVERHGLLVVVPDPTVCFAGARYRQTQDIRLDASSGLVLVDWITSGRRAYGEQWLFDRYDARLSIHVDGQLVVYDGLRLAAEDGGILPRMGRFNVFATVAVFGSRVAPDAVRIATEVQDAPLQKRASLLVTAATIGEAGCLLRVAGDTVEAVGRRIRSLLAFVPALLGDDPWSRKW